jgi:phage tail sheath gpL-like
MTTNERQDADARRILAEAQAMCQRAGTGITITLIGTIGEQFVVMFSIASLHDKTPAQRDEAIADIASNLRTIRGVARVCYEVLPDPRASH